MSAAEFDMWMIRASTEPFLAKRIDAGFAHIAMWLHNVNVKKGKAKPLSEFLLFKPEEPEPTGSMDDQVMGVFSKLIAKPKGK